MKINDKSLSKYANSGPPPDKEGYLNKRGDLNRGYQKRWFVLKGNLLFYYDKRQDKDPIGMIVVEGCTIELSDQEDGFTFMLHFPGSGTRTYILSADTQEEMEAWMKALSGASYEYMKVCVNELKGILKDPASTSQRKLVQSAFEDRNHILHSTHSSSSLGKKKLPTAPKLAHLKRHNPFDDNTSDNESSIKSFSTLSIDSVEGRTRTFLEMHEDYRQQIEEITEQWLKSHQDSPLAKFRLSQMTL